MFKLTADAAKQIRRSAADTGTENLALRIAAKRRPDGGIEYGMGFDVERANDIQLLSEGITLLISHLSKDLLQGTALDFVELNPGEFEFIFINPNDADGAPAAGGAEGSAGWAGGGQT
jgi:iron-sulfur cluster assembly protein